MYNLNTHAHSHIYWIELYEATRINSRVAKAVALHGVVSIG